MSSTENSLTEPKERPETGSFGKIARITESIAKELSESLSGVVINVSTCLRMLEEHPPNVNGAREIARRAIRDSNRAAEAISRLSTHVTEKIAKSR